MPTRDAPDSDLAQALAAHQAGDLAEAELLFQRVLAAAPRHPVALQRLGVIALQRGRPAPAAALLAEAAAASPDDAGIQFNLALALRALDRVDDAAAGYQRALALAPDFADAHVNLANLRRGQGRLDEARAGYERAIAVAPRHAGAHNNLGSLLQDLGAHAAAAAAHRQALALNPRSAGAHSNLGNALFALGQGAEAAAVYRQAIALDPTLAHAHLGLANTLRQSGGVAGAVAALEAALAARPTDAEILSQLVYGLQQLCRWDDLAARQAALLAAVEAGAVAMPSTLLSVPSTPAQQQSCARAWMARMTAGVEPLCTGRATAAHGSDSRRLSVERFSRAPDHLSDRRADRAPRPRPRHGAWLFDRPGRRRAEPAAAARRVRSLRSIWRRSRIRTRRAASPPTTSTSWSISTAAIWAPGRASSPTGRPSCRSITWAIPARWRGYRGRRLHGLCHRRSRDRAAGRAALVRRDIGASAAQLSRLRHATPGRADPDP
ncbi:MAG: tetratricopeptide repeat protein [Pseudomonadota bacterium]